MNIKTKYSIGDKIFIIEKHRDSQNENQYTYNLINEPVKINSIMVHKSKNFAQTIYRCKHDNKLIDCEQDNVFVTLKSALERYEILRKPRAVVKLSDIIIPEAFSNNTPAPYKIVKRLNEYKETGQFKKEILLSCNMKLIDGYTTYLCCKMFGIEEIVCIIENNLIGFKNENLRIQNQKTINE